MFFIYDEIGSALAEGIVKGYRKGIGDVVKLNKRVLLRIFTEKDLFNISYSKADKDLLRNFNAEAFTVAGVLSYECEEKLKAMAASIMDGNHPYMQQHPEASIKDVWQDEAYNVLSDYIQMDKMPPPGQLQTNLRTAVTSAYHGAYHQKLQQLTDIYPAYQYMTRDDNRVREAHRALHGKVFNANDPIWGKILPPNGWNCRCYFNPLTEDELRDTAPDDKIDIADKESKDALTQQARIDPNFNRNSGETKSIWGKWLQSKLTDKKYGEIADRMKEFANQMPDPNDAIEQLKTAAAEYRTLEYSKENWEKEFPDNKAMTPLGEFEIGWRQLDKLKGRATTRDETLNRIADFGLIKPTVNEPEFIIVHKNDKGEYGTLFLKAFKGKDELIFVSVMKDFDGRVVFTSFSDRKITNVKNKVRDGKLLIFNRQLLRVGASASRKEFATLPEYSSFADSNIQNDAGKSNETWAYFNSPGKIDITEIFYRVEGFEYSINGGVVKQDTYDRLDEYRKGVLILAD